MIKNKIIIYVMSLLLCSSFMSADKLADIQKAGVLKAGIKTDFDPFGFKSRKGDIIGFDVDMLQYIAKQLDVKLELIPVTSTNRINYILDNKVDIVAASMTHKTKRDRNIDFSITYFFDGQSILARKESSAKDYKDFEGKDVGTLKGSTSGKVFEVVLPLSNVVYFQNVKSMINALKNKEIDAITSDYAFLSTQAKKSKGLFKTIGKPFTLEPYGMGLKENESNLRDEINFAIQKSVKTGEYENIYVKWFNKKPSQKPTLWP